MAIAARPTKPAVDFAERVLAVATALSETELESFAEAFVGAVRAGKNGNKNSDFQAVVDLLESYEWMLRARQDPEHQKRIARVNEPISEALTVDQIRERYGPKPSR